MVWAVASSCVVCAVDALEAVDNCIFCRIGWYSFPSML